MMKNLYLVSFIIVLPIFMSCSDKAVNSSVKSTEKTGWVDEDTFRIAADGEELFGNDDSRKEAGALDAARRNAQFKIKQKFINTLSMSEVLDLYEKGRVVSKQYNAAEKKMNIIYEVKRPGLKRLSN
ncbi:MAG: hypothetical protein MUD12_00740 [Spirochaetes bacterium]|nr:hypothetical protein [Spirochaetota bacterium]